jgi:hypothetical protein
MTFEECIFAKQKKRPAISSLFAGWSEKWRKRQEKK